MNSQSRIEHERNERDMLALFRKLDWKEQLMLIGRMEVMTERGKVIPLPTDVKRTIHKGCMV